MEGWVKIHRALLEWEWFGDHKTLTLFIYCILKANTEDKKWRGEKINRGEFITSLSQIATATSLTMKELRVRLQRLEDSGEIMRSKGKQWTKITICNYGDYQKIEKPKGREKTQEGHRKDTERATTKEEDKKNKNIPTLQEFGAYAKEVYVKTLKKNPDPYKMAVKLKYDSWVAAGWKDGNGKAIKNWKSKFLNTIQYLEPIEDSNTNYNLYLQ